MKVSVRTCLAPNESTTSTAVEKVPLGCPTTAPASRFRSAEKIEVGTGLLGRTIRLLQTGSISGYAFLVGLGVTVIIYCVVVR